MPNHIMNIITIKDDESSDFEEIKGFVKSSDGNFDFNKIIPMPQDIYRGDVSYSDQLYGDKTWYHWSIKNWGTKWNAYDIRIGKYDTFIFQTAWNHPVPIIEFLSNKFPKTVLNIAYSDEDRGYNLGIYKIKNGKKVFEQKIKEGSKFAEILSDLIWAGDQIMDDPEMTQWELDEQAKWDKMIETIKKVPQLFGPVLDELVETEEKEEFIDDNPWNPEPTYEVPGMKFE